MPSKMGGSIVLSLSSHVGLVEEEFPIVVNEVVPPGG